MRLRFYDVQGLAGEEIGGSGLPRSRNPTNWLTLWRWALGTVAEDPSVEIASVR